MDERTADQLLYIEATLVEIKQLAARGREAYAADIAVARACQYNIIRLAADLERLGEPWLESHPDVPWRLIKGMRNRIAHNYWTVDDDIVWAVVSEHAQDVYGAIAEEINAARSALETADDDNNDTRER